MNILYVDWNCFGANDVIEAFRSLGHTVTGIELTEACHSGIDWSFVDILGKRMELEKIDVLFSFNFFPTLSEACYKYERKYMAWVYDSPYIKIYNPSIVNECNYVFTFDRAVAEELNQKGIYTVHYAPLAVNTDRLALLQGKIADKERYKCEIAFVGSLYNEKHNFYERLEEKADNPYLIGYLNGLMEAQQKVYGYNFLQECLSPDIVKMMYDLMPVEGSPSGLVGREYVYADYFLCRRMACLERTKVLERLSEKYQVYYYTHNAETKIGQAENKGKVEYYSEMPLAFRYAKINLNMTLRSIKTGIPLRAMDIMGAGGFLLTNYQEDFLLHFEPDRDFVYYGSIEELEDKVAYYLKHDTERKRIAKNGYQRIVENHTYKKSLERMLKEVV